MFLNFPQIGLKSIRFFSSTPENKRFFMASSTAASSPPAVDQTPAGEFLSFVDASVSPFHAVEEAAARLTAAGWQRISEASPWALQAGGRYFYTRNSSTLCAFAVGSQFSAGNGFHMVGAHTDSPVLRLKPKTNVVSQGYLQLGVQCYGGGLWRTWFDRDLSVAGRLVCRAAGGGLEQHLVRVDEPILRIPSLAIHLRPPEELNNETHLAPVLATLVKEQLSDGLPHHQGFLSAVAAASTAPVDVGAIVDFELCLYDTQPSAIGGLRKEFVFAPRLDNLMSSFCSLRALIETSSSAEVLAEEPNVRACLLFDNEEDRKSVV